MANENIDNQKLAELFKKRSLFEKKRMEYAD